MPSSTHDFTYTALEQLLLFHTLSSAHPIQSSTFVHVSNTLLKHPAVRADDTFDRGRLSPEALRERFTWLLREFNKTGDLGSICTMVTEMYDEYKRGIVRDIREDERRFLAARKEIKEIEEGKWDEKLLKEWETLNANKNLSETVKTAVTMSPASEKSLLIRSPRPEKEKPVKKDKEQEKESEKEKRAKAAASLPLKVNELVHKRPPGPPQVRPDVIPHPVQQRPREDGIPLGREALSVGSMQGHLQQPHSLDLSLQSITPSIPSAPVSAIRGEPAPTPSPHAPVPPISHIRHSDAPTSIRAFSKAPVLTPNKPSLGHPASPSPILTPTPLPPNHHAPPIISRVHQVSPHRQTSASPGPQHQFQPQHSPIRRQPMLTAIAIQPQQARWQQNILQPSQPPPPQISPKLQHIQPHYSPRPQSPHGQISVSGHQYGPAHQSAPRTPVGAYFPHPQTAQSGSPAFQHSHQQIVRPPVVPYQSSPYGVYQQPIHRSPAPPFAQVPPLQSGQSTPMQASPRRHPPPPPATGSPFTPLVAGYPPPNPGSPRQPGPEDISPISTPPSSPRPEKATPSPLKLVENPRPSKRPLEQSPHETTAYTKDKKPPAKRQRSSMKAQKPHDIPQDTPAVITGLPTIPDSIPAGERSISPVGEVISPTPGRGRGKPLSTPKTPSPRIRSRGRGKNGAPISGREIAPSGSPTSTSPSLEKAQVYPSKPEESSKTTHSEPISTISTPTTVKRRPGSIAKANLIIPSTGNAPSKSASPLKRKRTPSPTKSSVNGDVTDDDNLPTLEHKTERQTSPKKVDLPQLQLKQPPPKPTPISTTSGSSVSGASPAGLNAPPLVAVGQQPMVVATKKFTTLTAPLLANISGHRYANLFSAPVIESRAPGYRELIRRPQDLKSIKAAIRAGTLFVQSLDTNPSTAATPTRSTPPVFPSAPSISTPYLPTSSTATSITMPATTLNTPPKGIVNSLQLEKELFRMFANAVMYNKTNTEIVKETNIMAKDVEAMVTNFRGAEEVGTRKALAAKEKEGPQWGGRRTLFQREGTDDRTQGAARDKEAGKDGEKGYTGEGGYEEEDDGKSETVTTTEEPAHVPRKRGRPKRRKDDEATG